MSAALLRDAARRRIQEQLDAQVEQLVDGIERTPDQVRISQGTAQGLKQALYQIDEAYRELHS